MIMAACVGFIAGTLVAFVVYSMLAQSAMFTTGAVVDRVIARTVADPSLPPALEGRDPAIEYDENAAAAREGCTPGQLMAGRRRCPVAPAERPR